MPTASSSPVIPDKREAQIIIHSLGTSGQPPKLGATHTNVGTEPILRRLREDYVEGICASIDGLDGQGVCKLVEGDYGNGKTQFLRCFQETAWRENYVTAFVELSQEECPLDRNDRVFSAVARAVQARPLNAADVDRTMGFDQALAQLLDRKFPQVLTGLPDESLKAEAIQWVESELKNLPVESTAFRIAATTHLLARLHGDEEKGAISGMFLRGDPVPPAELKKLGIFEKNDKANGFRLLRSMCQLLQRSGLAAGTALLFDEARRTLSLMSSRGQRVACEGLLSVINGCNDGKLPGTIFVYGVLPEFFTQFADNYPALQGRISVSSRIRINTIEGIPETELLLKIGRRIAQIFDAAYSFAVPDSPALDENFRRLATAAILETAGTGTRRLFVKTCVQMLSNARKRGFERLDAAGVEKLLAGASDELRGSEAAAVAQAGE